MHVTDDLTVSVAESWPPERMSWTRNGEDVVLLRALGQIRDGRFLEVRAGGSDGAAALRRLVEHGWTGDVIDLDGAAARNDDPADDTPLHAVLVATDVAAQDFERIVGLARLDPWVLIVGVHPDLDRAPLVESLAAAGYRSCLYDGVSAYFVATDRAADLGPALSYPACARDGYLPGGAAKLVRAAHQREQAALESALRWRDKAVRSWADGSVDPAAGPGELRALRRYADDLAAQLAQHQQTLSWRVTAPLRRVRRLGSANLG